MPGRAPRRYRMDENGTVRSAFHGKLPEEFTEQDMLAFAADTDLLLQKVSEETLAAIHAAGYDYQGGAVIPRPGKEETNMAEQETKIPAQKKTQTAPPMKLDDIVNIPLHFFFTKPFKLPAPVSHNTVFPSPLVADRHWPNISSGYSSR